MAKVPDPDLGRSDWGPGAAGVRQSQEQQRGQHGGAVGTTGQRFREVGRGLAGRHTDPGFSPECEEGATEDSDKGGRGLITPQVARAGGALLSSCQDSGSSGLVAPPKMLRLMSIELVIQPQPNHLIPCRPFSSCLQSFPASGSFPVSQFFASGDQSIGASASARLPQPSSNAQQPCVVHGYCVKTFPSSQEVLGARPGAVVRCVLPSLVPGAGSQNV